AGFDTLAGRTFRLEISPGDMCVGADPLAGEIRAASGDGRGEGEGGDDGAVTVDPGLPMDTAWRGSLPPAGGFEHVDDVPARGEGQRGGVCALTARGCVPEAVQDPVTGSVDVERVPEDEPVRVRATRTWVRLDARFGSVALRVGGEIPLMVT